MKTYIGFDFGLTRIGVATGQAVTASATELVTLAAKNGEPDWAEVDRIIADWQPSAIVVGLPVRADGSENPVAVGARKFGELLSARFDLPVFWMNEELSSHEAAKLLTKKAGRYNKADIDRLAAKIILESWLAREQSVDGDG